MAILLGMLLRWLREASGGIQKVIASLRAKRRSDEGVRLTAKCPKCGKPGFRMVDRQRTRPDVYGSRTCRVKWLCLDCDYRTESIEESN